MDTVATDSFFQNRRDAQTAAASGAFFRYGADAVDFLKNADPRLGRFIERTGPVERAVTPNLFAALAQTVISQQISSKAMATVWDRLERRLATVSPETVLAAGPAVLQECGVSRRKTDYIMAAAQEMAAGRLNPDELAALPDAEVCRRLTSLNGIGLWSAEMILIFCLQRPDILSFGDFGICKGLCRLHGHDRLDKPLFERYRERYSPYGTVASFFLWELAKKG